MSLRPTARLFGHSKAWLIGADITMGLMKLVAGDWDNAVDENVIEAVTLT